MLFKCGAGKESRESFGLRGDQSSHSKWNQSWILFGKTDAEAEVPML